MTTDPEDGTALLAGAYFAVLLVCAAAIFSAIYFFFEAIV